MAKHRKPSNNVARNAAAASAVAMGASAVLANPAQAAEVVVPGTAIRFEVAGIENVQGIQTVPGVEQWIPSLGQQAGANYNAAVTGPVVQTPSTGQAIVDIARTKIGSPYVWGAAGPNAFDCSGFTTWVYQQVGKAIPRTSYAQAAGGVKVSRDQLQAGDIVAFYSGASHVGIYTGHGTVIHALNSSTPLSETPIDYMPFHSAVRY
ncbi:C40 family peptidase [Corynebacterium sp. 153RC1]|uniref:C40 family peptidase n=1 Tax=Corynebacterium TaxID=1716 RepID=UPI00211C7872|nr:C40 family peptidase [Corynebacterium sp. 76QC2CO]MCQ9352272.1 C40 family peptidase [Corynebacterium sp. 209RC1]MCQ9354338.1 C40 family peptidase [Corynebacterium sp. 1222RC1]MCQ9356620.1 C40 family peptidase [Corynebacterium sp. 122RC1]MCQ9359630.1 C40 family peptidase [Corynebacterium sp. 142RC1]MCQ9360572.1 C40 family peptidase [Corynebacterium sp. 153RC1]MCQ9362566.1 C40 family peptidase [Corynebacterium sp. 732RC1]MCQ9365777.1 C40 family peptidase [Corynebacterium sp. 70RC1]MCQ93698